MSFCWNATYTCSWLYCVSSAAIRTNVAVWHVRWLADWLADPTRPNHFSSRALLHQVLPSYGWNFRWNYSLFGFNGLLRFNEIAIFTKRCQWTPSTSQPAPRAAPPSKFRMQLLPASVLYYAVCWKESVSIFILLSVKTMWESLSLFSMAHYIGLNIFIDMVG